MYNTFLTNENTIMKHSYKYGVVFNFRGSADITAVSDSKDQLTDWCNEKYSHLVSNDTHGYIGMKDSKVGGVVVRVLGYYRHGEFVIVCCIYELNSNIHVPIIVNTTSVVNNIYPASIESIVNSVNDEMTVKATVSTNGTHTTVFGTGRAWCDKITLALYYNGYKVQAVPLCHKSQDLEPLEMMLIVTK